MSTRRAAAPNGSASYQSFEPNLHPQSIPTEYFPTSYGPSASSSQSLSSGNMEPHPAIAPSESELGDSTSDFVKKLFKMLATPAHQSIVHWNSTGDSFIVNDMNGFTTKILPKLFKHSNFASFVRQLNKYDFHKVKSEDGGEGTWTFKHPDFTSNNKSALENIKRKVPANRKSLPHTAPTTSTSLTKAGSEEPTPPVSIMPSSGGSDVRALRIEIERLKNDVETMASRMRNLERLLEESGRRSSNSATLASDSLHSSPTQLPQLPKLLPPQPSPLQQQLPQPYAFLQSPETQSLLGNSADNVGRESLNWMGEMSLRPGAIPPYATPLATTVNPQVPRSKAEDDEDEVVMPTRPSPPASSSSGPTLEVFTLGHLMPRSRLPQDEVVPASSNSPSENAQQQAVVPSQQSSMQDKQKLRVRRATYIPGWSVPPKVLLVDDDEVARRLSSKFLNVFGCTTDVAIDGASAVNKMGFQKYDLVLMDIVMPKMDGVSATSMIRKFDHRTPIISMTSNSRPDEIITYYSSGMNDVLPKPFTKQGLFDMLEKHLHHLHQNMQMQKVSTQLPPRLPPAGGASPPISASNSPGGTTSGRSAWPVVQHQIQTPHHPDYNQSSTAYGGYPQSSAPDYSNSSSTWYTTTSATQMQANPLGGIGLTEEGYNEMLHGIVRTSDFNAGHAGDSIGAVFLGVGMKRDHEDSEDGRDGKRGRFEVIE